VVVDEAPWVSRIAHRHHAEIGGFAFSADGKRVVIVATLDNLLKGAATQAMQNINHRLRRAGRHRSGDDWPTVKGHRSPSLSSKSTTGDSSCACPAIYCPP
jgi:hypothetical protein